MSEAKLREEICAIGQSIFARGLTAGAMTLALRRLRPEHLSHPGRVRRRRADAGRRAASAEEAAIVASRLAGS